jgi:hypothetical protein
VQASDGFIVATHARASDGDLEGIVVSGRALGRDVFIFKVDERGEFVESWADRGRFVLGAERGTQDRQENPNDFIFGIRLLEDGGLVGCGYTVGKSIVLDNMKNFFLIILNTLKSYLIFWKLILIAKLTMHIVFLRKTGKTG